MSCDATLQEQDLGAQIAELRAELRELQDKEAIRERMDHYAFLLDTARWRDIPEEIFTEDGVDYHLPDNDPPYVPRGRKELREFFEAFMPAFAGTQHILGNSHIEIRGDEAYSRTYAIASHWDPEEPGVEPSPSQCAIACGYDDRWRRTEDGWRVFERRLHIFGPSGLVAGRLLDFQTRVGADVYGSRDR